VPEYRLFGEVKPQYLARVKLPITDYTDNELDHLSKEIRRGWGL
jgi:hypothetical protein